MASMKKYIALSFTFLLIAIYIKASTTRSEFRCPVQTSSMCSCTQKESIFYIKCANSTGNIVIKISPGDYVNVQCDKDTPPMPSAYKELPFGNNTYIKTMNFQYCLLPETSFANLMYNMKITNVNVFIFKSFKKCNDTLTNHLEGTKDVTELHLLHNGLTYLPDYIFDHMKSLVWVNLAYNNIQLTKDLFKSLTTVRRLNLEHNQILKLTKNIFSHMSQLKQLFLSHNNMAEIMPAAFNGLNNLIDLDLSNNNLKTLPFEVLNNLVNLNILWVQNNYFINFSDRLFVNNEKLNRIILNYNNAPLSTLPDRFLADLHYMEAVDLNNNQLERVTENLFSNSTYLKEIYLNKNLLEHIPIELFSDQKNLVKLDLSSNHIKSLHTMVFDNLANLETLILDNNLIEHLQSDLLNSLIRLEQFSVNNNFIHTIDNKAFSRLKSLTKIDMSYNYLAMSTCSQLKFCIKLTHVNFSHNQITEICDDWILDLPHLKLLNLSNNIFTEIQYESFVTYPTLILDLTLNKITTLSLIEREANDTDEDMPNILVENNPVNCDCNLHDFIDYFGDRKKSHVWNGVNNLMCNNPPNFRGTFVKDVKLDELLCRVNDSCPDNCECFKRYYDKAFIVKCTNITIVPTMPKNPKGTNHTELHLENNRISSFSELDLDTRNRNITMLYLQNNRITDLRLPKYIEVLDLSNNQLQYIDAAATAALYRSGLRELHLLNNSLACDCENHDFLSFLQDRHRQIKDFEFLTCSDGQQISSLKLGLLCGPSRWLIVTLVLFALAGLTFGVCVTLFCKYKHQIKIYLFAKGWLLSWVTEEEVDKDKLYDAFLSFSHKDDDFVINELVTVLESRPQPYKLCIHLRDWVAGELIPTQIRRSVKDSRRTIVVLSPNFLDSVWGQLEFKEAYSHALQEGRARVIIILLCDIDELKKMDPELQAYLDNNTYVKWGDPWFWKKLRYALPHRPFIANNVSDSKINNYEDKLDINESIKNSSLNLITHQDNFPKKYHPSFLTNAKNYLTTNADTKQIDEL